jgi:hypothetical protein
MNVKVWTINVCESIILTSTVDLGYGSAINLMVDFVAAPP